MKIYESAEMYLETVLVLSQREKNVRMIDVANTLGFSKPSVSVFLKQLRQNGYLTADENGCLALTEKGLRVAEPIYERHRAITAFLTSIGVSEETAAQDACRIEHVLSDESFACMKEYFKKTENNNRE